MSKRKATARPAKAARTKENQEVESSPAQQAEEMSKDLTQYVTTRQAAKMMGVVTDHVNHLLAQGKIKGVKMDTRWLVYIPSIRQYAPPKSSGGRPRSKTAQPEDEE